MLLRPHPSSLEDRPRAQTWVPPGYIPDRLVETRIRCSAAEKASPVYAGRRVDALNPVEASPSASTAGQDPARMTTKRKSLAAFWNGYPVLIQKDPRVFWDLRLYGVCSCKLIPLDSMKEGSGRQSRFPSQMRQWVAIDGQTRKQTSPNRNIPGTRRRQQVARCLAIHRHVPCEGRVPATFGKVVAARVNVGEIELQLTAEWMFSMWSSCGDATAAWCPAPRSLSLQHSTSALCCNAATS